MNHEHICEIIEAIEAVRFLTDNKDQYDDLGEIAKELAALAEVLGESGVILATADRKAISIRFGKDTPIAIHSVRDVATIQRVSDI